MSDRCEYCYGCTCPGDCSGAHLAAKDRARADRAEAELRRVYLAVRNQDVCNQPAEIAWDMVDELRDELAAERARTTAANALLQEAVRLRTLYLRERERANELGRELVAYKYERDIERARADRDEAELATARSVALREAAGVPSRVIAELRRRGLLTAGDESVARTIESGILALIGASESGGGSDGQP